MVVIPGAHVPPWMGEGQTQTIIQNLTAVSDTKYPDKSFVNDGEWPWVFQRSKTAIEQTSSETQGLLAGTTRYFRAKVYFKS